jgi:cardiolipin synthase C
MFGRRNLTTAILFPLFLWLAWCCGCASLPLDYPRTVTSALYFPEGATTMGQKINAMVVEHQGASGFYLLPDAIDAFAARTMLIDEAEKTLDMQYYIFHGDLSGNFLLDRIVAAAQRGVRVRLLVDDWHQTEEMDWWLAMMAIHPNIEVRVFNPFGGCRSSPVIRLLAMAFGPTRLKARMHNKRFIVDNSAAIVGGRNIGDEYFGASQEFNFYDMDILAIGPIVRRISANFDDYWHCVLSVPLKALIHRQPSADDLRAVRQGLETKRESLKNSTYGLKVRESDFLQKVEANRVPFVWAQGEVLSDDPLKCLNWDDPKRCLKMARRLKEVVEGAKYEVLMISPYFVPGRRGVDWFKQLRDRNLKVKIITNSFVSTDAPPAQIGYMRYREDLLLMGVDLYELRPTPLQLEKDERRRLCSPLEKVGKSLAKTGNTILKAGKGIIWTGGSLLTRGVSLFRFGIGSGSLFGSSSRGSLHAKTIVLDRGTVFVGSFNLDPRSVRLDTQNGIVICSPELGCQMASLFQRASSPDRTFHVTILGDSGLVWVTEEKNHEMRYSVEPLTSFWDRLSMSVMSWIAPEWLL